MHMLVYLQNKVWFFYKVKITYCATELLRKVKYFSIVPLEKKKSLKILLLNDNKLYNIEQCFFLTIIYA